MLMPLRASPIITSSTSWTISGSSDGRRLVEEDHLGIHRQRASDGRALLLPAGQLSGVLRRVCGDADTFEQFHAPLLGSLARDLADMDRTERDVLQDRLVGEEVERLEHHADLRAQSGERGPLLGQRPALEADRRRGLWSPAG